MQTAEDYREDIEQMPIRHYIIYHTSLDAPELVPATGLERATRAFAAALDRSNTMTLGQLRGPNFPGKSGQGSLIGIGQPNTRIDDQGAQDR